MSKTIKDAIALARRNVEAIGKSRGLGDTIHKITTTLHIPHCGGCEQRRQALNKLLPYKP